ncbi:MAG: cardiolipin synthase [Phycisphaeraceae bacterium]
MSWLLVWSIVEWVIIAVMVLVILRRRFTPVTSLAWLALTFLQPVAGLVIYLFVGVSYLGRRRAKSHRLIVGGARSPQRVAKMRIHRDHPDMAPGQQNMIIQAEGIGGNPIVGGNSVSLIHDAGDLVDRLVDDIDRATDHVHLLFYIYWPDSIGTKVSQALQRAAKRGVKCRLLADSAGSRPLFRSRMADDLRKAGVELVAALPVAPWRRRLARIDLRNHRKIAVVDGHVAYTGSHNVVEEDYGHKRAGKWVDLSARFTGPVVAQLQMVFLDDWAFETGRQLTGPALFPPLEPTGPVWAQAVPTGPNHEAETFRRVLVAAINVARERIIITTPYLVPDEPTTLALSMAIDRGAEVTIQVPEKSDHPIVAAAGRWYFEQLMDMGVSLHRYGGGMLHAKTLTVDDAFALLGSANIDVRSFYLNFEINVLLYGDAITGQLREAQQEYLASSRKVDPEQWHQRPIVKQYVESAAALLSPLL